MNTKITLDNLYEYYHEPDISELKDGDIITWVVYASELPKNWGKGIMPSNNYPRKLTFYDRLYPGIEYTIQEIESILKQQKDYRFNDVPNTFVAQRIMIKNKENDKV